MIALSPEVKPVESTIDTSNLQETTNDELKQLADGIVNNPENQEQVKFFPDQWNSLNDEEKAEFAWQLTAEIQKSITKLNDLWIEYNPKITKWDENNVYALRFLIEHQKEVPPQLWSEIEKKAEEIAKDIRKEIEDTGILNVVK